METVELEEDLSLLTVRAERFPEGIQEAFDTLRKKLPPGDQRTPYGVSKPETNGTIVYRAGVATHGSVETPMPGLETIVLKKGFYAVETINGWQEKIHTLSEVFGELLQHPQLDPASPCIEVYRSRTVLVCMVRVQS